MSERDYFAGDSLTLGTTPPHAESLDLLRLTDGNQKSAVEKVGYVQSFLDIFRSDDSGKLRQQINKQFGVQIRETPQGEYDYFYKADGAEHNVAHSAATTDGLRQAQKQLDDLAHSKMRDIENTYKVKFATPGENVEHKLLKAEHCLLQQGEMIHASQPGLPQLYAVDKALQHSQPSQFGPDGKDGIKIYFLDKQPYPAITEGKFALGVFIDKDKDKHRALYITPEGAQLAPTAADVSKPDERNLTWCVEHEITHNSQQNMCPIGRMPSAMAEAMGWQRKEFKIDDRTVPAWTLTAKNGDEFMQGRLSCNDSPEWLRIDDHGELLTPQGTLAKGSTDIERVPGSELRHQLPIEPPTYYFTDPKEMMSESLTAYRYGPETRARLLRESPALYGVVQKYDQQELDKVYGVDTEGRSNYLRSPDGFAVPRSHAVEDSINSFERNNTLPY